MKNTIRFPGHCTGSPGWSLLLRSFRELRLAVSRQISALTSMEILKASRLPAMRVDFVANRNAAVQVFVHLQRRRRRSLGRGEC
ncbi:MAG: hypothetical protein IPJ00_22575 [Saprospirales bacterium]|nr:hypothetical protein [Saprospirales bacterium]